MKKTQWVGTLVGLACMVPMAAQQGKTAESGAEKAPPTQDLRAHDIFANRTLVFGRNLLDPLLPGGPWPLHLQVKAIEIMQHRFGFGDSFNTELLEGRIEHGGANYNNGPSQGTNMNFQSMQHNLFVNTEGQIGGAFGQVVRHYGLGDAVTESLITSCTGISRGQDEGCEMNRNAVQFHTDNWGIQVGVLITKPETGQVILQAAPSGTLPAPLEGHNLRAAFENGPILDIAPAKAYRAGNVASMALCPASLVADREHYGCLTGDAVSAWTATYGTSQTTTLAQEITNDGPSQAPAWSGAETYAHGDFVTFAGHTYYSVIEGNTKNSPFAGSSNAAWTLTDRFATGAVCGDWRVTNPAIFTLGKLLTISSPENNFEMVTVLSVDARKGTVHACFTRTHAKGELMTTGGGVGHAISMTLDDMAPHTAPALDETNQSTYRLAYPILGTFPGNIILTWMNPFNQGNRLATRALGASTPRKVPSFTPELHDGALVGTTNYASGDMWTSNPSWFGGIQHVPPPAISFGFSKGGRCAELPKAHALPSDGGSTVHLAIESGGRGCTSDLTIKVQSVYPNPYSIYPMAWAESNQDPNFVIFPDHDPQFQIDPNQIVTASTSGYMATGGALPCSAKDGFCVGDPVEGTYSGHQHLTSSRSFHRWVFDPGVNGITDADYFTGYNSNDSLKGLVNQQAMATYYGTPADHWTADAQGNGNQNPPTGNMLKGAFSTVWWLDSPPRGNLGNPGVLVNVMCSDPNHPCAHDDWKPLVLFQSAAPGDKRNLSGGMREELDYDRGVLHISFPGYANGGVEAPLVQPTIPALRAKTGTRFLCIDTEGRILSQTTPCSGT